MKSRAIAAVIGSTLTTCIGIALAPPGSAAPGRSCPQGTYQISIGPGLTHTGDISCSDVDANASQYSKYQQIGPRTCYTYNTRQKGSTDLQFGCVYRGNANGGISGGPGGTGGMGGPETMTPPVVFGPTRPESAPHR